MPRRGFGIERGQSRGKTSFIVAGGGCRGASREECFILEVLSQPCPPRRSILQPISHRCGGVEREKLLCGVQQVSQHLVLRDTEALRQLLDGHRVLPFGHVLRVELQPIRVLVVGQRRW